MRLSALTFVVVLAVVASATAAANPVRATMSTSSTKPLVGSPWRYTITVRDENGKLLPGKARLQILAGTVVVGCWRSAAMVQCSGANSGTWIPFRGRRTDTITWPAEAAGFRLTFQATVVAAGRSLRLRAPVTPQLP
jgi:hypothetical protein